MHVKVLDFVEYRDGGRQWRSHAVIGPTWDQIETAIRRLDKFYYPFLQLWPTEDEEPHLLVDGCECFEVVGGLGPYWLAVSIGGYFQRRYLNPAGGDDDVPVWTSDQGFSDEDRHICKDIETVLHAARHYADFGGFDPLITWE